MLDYEIVSKLDITPTEKQHKIVIKMLKKDTIKTIYEFFEKLKLNPGKDYKIISKFKFPEDFYDAFHEFIVDFKYQVINQKKFLKSIDRNNIFECFNEVSFKKPFIVNFSRSHIMTIEDFIINENGEFNYFRAVRNEDLRHLLDEYISLDRNCSHYEFLNNILTASPGRKYRKLISNLIYINYKQKKDKEDFIIEYNPIYKKYTAINELDNKSYKEYLSKIEKAKLKRSLKSNLEVKSSKRKLLKI